MSCGFCVLSCPCHDPLSDQSADDYDDDDTEMQISIPEKSKSVRQSGKAFLKVYVSHAHCGAFPDESICYSRVFVFCVRLCLSVYVCFFLCLASHGLCPYLWTRSSQIVFQLVRLEVSQKV